MPEFYGEELDRQKMWERISNGVIVSIAKSNKEWDKFINDLLVYIKADMVRVASSVALHDLMAHLSEKPPSYHKAWLRYFETRQMILIPFARLAWQGRKDPMPQSQYQKTTVKPVAKNVHINESVTNDGELF